MYYFAIVNRLLFRPFFLSLTTFLSFVRSFSFLFFIFTGNKHHSPIYMGDLYTPTWPKHIRSIVYRWLPGDAEEMAMEFL